MFLSLVKLKNNKTSVKKLHTSVLVDKALEYLNVAPNKIYIDMTFGAGGHSRSILRSSENVKIFALDRDPVAYNNAKLLKEEYPGQIIPMLGRFSDLPKLLKQYSIHQNSIDGMLFDFGCSSMQFDNPQRGFSLSSNGPLDMRMDGCHIKDRPTVEDILANIEEIDLVKILKIYGEEKAAKKIARTIIEARSTSLTTKTTKQLADLVLSCMANIYREDKLQRPTHPATKTFQALRIFVNNELNELNYGMFLARKYLKIRGRIVTIAFHSLEDTIVKRHFSGNIINGLANPIPLKYCSHSTIHEKKFVEPLIESYWAPLHKHVVVPDVQEVSANPRSRSAKMRAAIKIR